MSDTSRYTFLEMVLLKAAAYGKLLSFLTFLNGYVYGSLKSLAELIVTLDFNTIGYALSYKDNPLGIVSRSVNSIRI